MKQRNAIPWKISWFDVFASSGMKSAAVAASANPYTFTCRSGTRSVYWSKVVCIEDGDMDAMMIVACINGCRECAVQ